jgi:hypothetical protein
MWVVGSNETIVGVEKTATVCGSGIGSKGNVLADEDTDNPTARNRRTGEITGPERPRKTIRQNIGFPLGASIVADLTRVNPGYRRNVVFLTRSARALPPPPEWQFPEPTTVNPAYGGGGVGGGFARAANNRRIEFDLRFKF